MNLVRKAAAEPAEPYWRFRVLVAVPEAGWGGQLGLMREWLDAVCGPGGWASAPAGLGGVANDAIAFYFAQRAAARAFLFRFSCGYRVSDRPEI